MRMTQVFVVWYLLIIALCFVIIGCPSAYKVLGFTPAESEIMVEKDRKEIINVITDTRSALWETVTVIVAGLGTFLSAYLARMLGTERKLNKAIIIGVESSPENGVKESIQKSARKLGVGDKLAKRVATLT